LRNGFRLIAQSIEFPRAAAEAELILLAECPKVVRVEQRLLRVGADE